MQTETTGKGRAPNGEARERSRGRWRERQGRSPRIPGSIPGEDPQSRARALGWVSVALGSAQILAPLAVSRFTGVGKRRTRPWIMRAMGVRELACGVGLLVSKNPAPFLWARTAGDLIDLALLGRTFFSKGALRARVIGSAAAIAAVTVADAVTAAQHRKVPKRSHTVAITISAAPDEAERLWAKHNLSPLRPTFRPAPGERGTEVCVVLDERPSGAAPLRARLYAQRVLRQFKQVVEVGEIVRSDASIHVGMHPARPPAPGRFVADEGYKDEQLGSEVVQ